MKSNIAFDKSGIAVSLLCIVHCLFLPIIGAVLPIIGTWSDIEWVHKALVFLAFPLAVSIIVAPVPFYIRILAALGVSLLFASAFFEPLHDIETHLTVTGALILAGLHIMRLRQEAHRH
jgi:hypothetical protein